MKSARRFRKTISTLASQRVACIPGIPRTALLNLRAMNDVERNARLENLEHKITGANNEILTAPIHVRPLKHVVGRDQCRKMTQYSYLCIKPWQTWSTLLIYKCTCVTCNESRRWCLNHSITNFHSQVQPGRIFHQGQGPSGPPTPVLLNLNNPTSSGGPTVLVHCGIEALVY